VQFYILRKLIEHEWKRKRGVDLDHKHAYICSLSAQTIVYKGQLLPQQVSLPSYLSCRCQSSWRKTPRRTSTASLHVCSSITLTVIFFPRCWQMY